MAEDKKPIPQAPYTGPYVATLPCSTAEHELKKFTGKRTPRSLQAARRMAAKQKTVKIPAHLMNKLLEATGGWYQVGFPAKYEYLPGDSSGTMNHPWVQMKQVKNGCVIDAKEGALYRDRAWVGNLSGLEICAFIRKDWAPDIYVRYRGVIFGAIEDKNLINRKKAEEFIRALCHRASSAEADDWGFLRPGEEVKK